jgi:hypothetical protein
MKNIITKNFKISFPYSDYLVRIEGEVDELGEAFTFSSLKIYDKDNNEMPRQDVIELLRKNSIIQEAENRVKENLGMKDAVIR